MKYSLRLFLAATAGIAVVSSGCGKPAQTVDASKPLEQSFKAAEPNVRQAVVTAASKLKTGDYPEATTTLSSIVTTRPLTEPQKEAVALALKQLNEAAAKDPRLDSKEMYEMRLKMFQAIRSGSRF